MDEEKNNSAPTLFEDKPREIPYAQRFNLVSDKRIIDTWFINAPCCKSAKELTTRTAMILGIPIKHVERCMRKAQLIEMAKEQRALITEEIYKDKIPLAKSIVGLSLFKLERFLERFKPASVTDAKELKNIAADINGLLRLETGQSTNNIDVHVTHKDADSILKELSENDPFKDYGDANGK